MCVQQIQNVIDAGIFEEIVNILKIGDFRSQNEAAWVFTNVTTNGTPGQIDFLLKRVGIFKPYCRLLESDDDRTVLVVLTFLKNLLRLAENLDGKDYLASACRSSRAF